MDSKPFLMNHSTDNLNDVTKGNDDEMNYNRTEHNVITSENNIAQNKIDDADDDVIFICEIIRNK